MTKNTKLSPPWIIFYKKLVMLFGEDPEIKLEYNNDDQVISMYVANDEKLQALKKLLPETKEFGNVKVTINLIPANAQDKNENILDLFATAFKDNPVFTATVSTSGSGLFGEFNYVVFEPKIAQFFNDDLSDVNGCATMLYHDLAKDVFGEKLGVFYCVRALEQDEEA